MTLTENIINQSEMSTEFKDFVDTLDHIEGSLYHGILSFDLFIQINSWIKQRREELRYHLD